MNSEYDVLVVGGGPGGAIAARTAAKLGLSVLLVEKRPAIGVPVRCAEGIGKDALLKFVDLDPKWISSDIQRAVLVGPDGTKFTIGNDKLGDKVGYVLDRKIFDRELVWQASDAGAEIQVHARAEPIVVDGKLRGAIIHQHGKTYKIYAKVIIAADGVESKFSKLVGIDTTVPMNELESCAQYIVNDIDIDPHANVFYLSNEACPGGYIWIFPKGQRCANIGIGIVGTKSGDGHRAKDYLDRYIAKEFPNGKITELIVGGVSVCKPLECTVDDNLIIVGDAARLSDPITGGGIYNAMYTGDLAGKIAVNAINNGDTSKKALMEYDTAWRKGNLGVTLARNYAVKEAFIKMDDEKLNSIIHSMDNLNIDDLSVKKLVLAIFKKNPWLIRELPSLIKLL